MSGKYIGVIVDYDVIDVDIGVIGVFFWNDNVCGLCEVCGILNVCCVSE